MLKLYLASSEITMVMENPAKDKEFVIFHFV